MGILDLLVLSSVNLGRSLESGQVCGLVSPEWQTSMYSIYLIPYAIVGTSYVLVLLILIIFLEDRYHAYFYLLKLSLKCSCLVPNLPNVTQQ